MRWNPYDPFISHQLGVDIMSKNNVILRLAIAAACGFGANSAMAVGTFTGPAAPVVYAAEAITSTSSLSVAATTGVYKLAAGGSINTGALLTFTLLGGATFAGTPPSLTVDTTGSCAPGGAVQLQTSTASSVTYTVTGKLSGLAGCQLNLGNFTVANVASLNSPAVFATPNKLELQIGGSLSTPAIDDPLPNGSAGQPNKATQLISISSATLNPGALANQGNNVKVDIATGGKNFVLATAPGGTAGSTATVAPLGTVRVDAVTGVNPITGTNATGSPAINNGTDGIGYSGATLNLTGNFNNIASAYVDTSACDKSATANKIAGTVSATGATFTGLKSGILYNVCAVANGTGVLWGLNNAINASATANYTNQGAGSTTLGGAGSPLGSFGPTTSAGNYAALSYNGVFGNPAYVVGSQTGGYQSYLRAGNNSGVAQKMYATVQMDDGTVYTGQLPDVAANAATLLTASDLNTATGSKLTSETDRANVFLFMTGPSASFGNIMLNPNQTVTSMP